MFSFKKRAKNEVKTLHIWFTKQWNVNTHGGLLVDTLLPEEKAAFEMQYEIGNIALEIYNDWSTDQDKQYYKDIFDISRGLNNMIQRGYLKEEKATKYLLSVEKKLDRLKNMRL